MRKLHLLVARSRTHFPVVLAVAWLPATACVGASDDARPIAIVDGSVSAADDARSSALPLKDGATGADESLDAIGNGRIVVDALVVPPVRHPDAGSTSPLHSEAGSVLAEVASAYCGRVHALETYTVPLPEEGTPLTVQAACGNDAAAIGVPAHLTLEAHPNDGVKAAGHLKVAQEFVGVLVGLPTITTTDPQTRITNVRPDADGFAFDVVFAEPPSEPRSHEQPLRFSIALQIRCSDAARDAVRMVESRADVVPCLEGDHMKWASPGEECIVCVPICEMAPSPLVASPSADPLPLGRAMVLNLKCAGRLGRSRILLAEHEAGPGLLSYTWRASGGSLVQLANDVALWTVDDTDGPNIVQVSAEARDTVAVASLRVGT